MLLTHGTRFHNNSNMKIQAGYYETLEFLYLAPIFTWLNTTLFVIFKLVSTGTIQAQPLYSILKLDSVYAFIFNIHCDNNQVQLLFKVWCLPK